MIDQAERNPQISARRFLAAFNTEANASSAELTLIWNMKSTDKPYTKYMSTQLFPATARGLNLHFRPEFPYKDADSCSRRLDAAYFPLNCGQSVHDALVAIELENKEQSISDEIVKLTSLRSRLCVLFFYSYENRCEKRIRQVQERVRDWDPSSGSEFLIMWNKPYESQPHWCPFLVTPAGIEQLARLTILDSQQSQE